MGLKKIKNVLINEDNYVYPYPELIFQTTREVSSLIHLGSGKADNDNGYIYFYADSDWKNNPNVYVGESKNDIQSRHNATHKNTAWFKNITYPLIGIVNSPNLPWDTDTRRAIESKTVYKLHNLGLQIVNGANSTWTNGGTVHPNVNDQYVEDVSGIIVDYIKHHMGFNMSYKSTSEKNSLSGVTSEPIQKSREPEIRNATPGKGLESPKLTTASEGNRSEKVKKYYPNISLSDLIEQGIISQNTEIVTNSNKYVGKATILADGTIRFNDKIYSSLSTVAGECRRITNPDISSPHPNGWDFWGVRQPDGSIKTLSKYRNQAND